MSYRFSIWLTATVSLILAPSAAIAGDHGKAALQTDKLAAAVNAPGRPADAIALDESRKPAQVLAFLGLKPGMHAADIVSGGGYWAEIMARAVGPKGTVAAFEPTQFYGDAAKVTWKALLERQPDIHLVTYPFEHFTAAPDSFDFAIMNLDYHDLYWQSEKFNIPKSDPGAFVSALYAGMKPGGVVGIIDHVGLPGDTRETVEKYHRIDPAVVKADFAKAGFVLEETSDMLRNPDDNHETLVFDPSIRGKTDRFLFKFRKPG